MSESMLFECKIYKPGEKPIIISKEEITRKYWDIDEVKFSTRIENFLKQGKPPRIINCAFCGVECEAKMSTTKYCQKDSCKNKRKKEANRIRQATRPSRAKEGR